VDKKIKKNQEREKIKREIVRFLEGERWRE
jgi:hypothetical protein